MISVWLFAFLFQHLIHSLLTSGFDTLHQLAKLTLTDLDKMSISNVDYRSKLTAAAQLLSSVDHACPTTDGTRDPSVHYYLTPQPTRRYQTTDVYSSLTSHKAVRKLTDLLITRLDAHCQLINVACLREGESMAGLAVLICHLTPTWMIWVTRAATRPHLRTRI